MSHEKCIDEHQKESSYICVLSWGGGGGSINFTSFSINGSDIAGQ
jgi:hypothetical protein